MFKACGIHLAGGRGEVKLVRFWVRRRGYLGRFAVRLADTKKLEGDHLRSCLLAKDCTLIQDNEMLDKRIRKIQRASQQQFVRLDVEQPAGAASSAYLISKSSLLDLKGGQVAVPLQLALASLALKVLGAASVGIHYDGCLGQCSVVVSKGKWVNERMENLKWYLLCEDPLDASEQLDQYRPISVAPFPGAGGSSMKVNKLLALGAALSQVHYPPKAGGFRRPKSVGLCFATLLIFMLCTYSLYQFASFASTARDLQQVLANSQKQLQRQLWQSQSKEYLLLQKQPKAEGG